MPSSPPRSRQEDQIRTHWPRSAKQLTSTYFTDPAWAITDSHGHNNAGYMLWALNRFAAKVCATLAHKEFTADELDLAASREIYYQWTHDRHFSSVPAALSCCLLNLVNERPEKLYEARRLQAGHRGPPASSSAPTVQGPSTGIRSASHGNQPLDSQPCLIASALPTLTRPNSTPTHSQAPLQPSYTCNSFVWAPDCESSQRTHGPTVTAA